MEQVYNAYIKEINAEPFYFIKHFLILTELDNSSPLLIGYGMHRVFEKACAIAGILEKETQQTLRRTIVPSSTIKVISLKDYDFSGQKESGLAI